MSLGRWRRRHVLLRVVVRDFVLLGVVFASFFWLQWLPRGDDANGQTIVEPSYAASTAVAGAAAQRASAAATTGSSPVATSTPEPGDFSASFPTGDTGKGALYSHQSDTLRVAVRKVKENDVTYYVADVWVRTIEGFQTAFANGKYGRGNVQMPVQMAKDNDAVLAVSGDYYGARSDGIVIRNGKLYRKAPLGDVCVLYTDGVMETYSKAEFDLDGAIERKAWQAWSFGPALLQEGKAIESFSDSIRGRNPRCAIGYFEPGHYCLVVVDGRQPGYSVGMTLAELSQTFEDLGCKAAYNLDGGQTAMMVFQGEPVNQAYKGGRQSSDIIWFGGK